VSALTAVFVVLVALLVAFSFILHTGWLLIAAVVVLLLGVIAGVTSAG
jgi:hypothetical protein